MVASRKVIQKDADKQSAIVQQFAESLAGGSSSSSSAAASRPAAAVVSSSAFVPRTEATEKAKADQRSWDRAELLKVDDEDAQVKIYNAYSQNANTNAEGVSCRRGLGASEGGGGGGGSVAGRKMMSFVSAGGEHAATPAATGSTAAATAPHSAAAAAPQPYHHPAAAPQPYQHPVAQPGLPAGWTMGIDPASGHPYYANPATGVTQWHPPPPDPPPPPAAPAPLPPGWVAATDPASGHVYYSNVSTGQTQWTVPLTPPTFAPMPAYSAAAASVAATPSGPGVRVRGLPASMSDADVREIFASCGRITAVVLDRSAYSSGSTPKGATVHFDASASAELAAKNMNGVKMRAATLSVELLSVGDGRPKPY